MSSIWSLSSGLEGVVPCVPCKHPMCSEPDDKVGVLGLVEVLRSLELTA